MALSAAPLQRIQVVDSHTAGEPTRVVLAGGPDLGTGSMAERRARLQKDHDGFRTAVVCEPRGSDVVVGALLCQPEDAGCATGVIFFNDVGYLGMCGHGTIGVVHTLAHLRRIQPGKHRIETAVGEVQVTLHRDGEVSVDNVPSYRYRSDVAVHVAGLGLLHGDIAWGGNWFFLVGDHGLSLSVVNRTALLDATRAIRAALAQQGITGANGELIDHIELFGPPENLANSSRNFVLCPGASFDRSPCGTGTSAKMACLFAQGKLQPGEPWRQEGILGTHFTGSVQPDGDRVLPTLTGRAFITAECTLLFETHDPFAEGIGF